MRDITHTDLELLYQLADGIDGEDADPGASRASLFGLMVNPSVGDSSAV